MNRITAGIAALFFAGALMADPPACPSVQWTLGQPSPSLAGYITDVAVVDYDEDGELDVVGVIVDKYYWDNLVWWKGAGNNTFGAPNFIVTNDVISNIAIADATGDGLDDVIVALYHHISPDLYILPATGSGRGPAIRRSLTVPTTVICAVNRDADPAVELVVTNAGGDRFAVYDDIATTITEPVRVSTAPLPRGVVSADFDADGRMDVAVGFPDGRTVAVYYGNADGAFDAPVDLGGVFPWNLVIGDLDGDGKQDIVAGNVNPDYVDGEGSVSIYMNQGGRAFTHTKFSVDKPGHAGVTYPVLLADVSGDGVLDLVTGNVSGWTTTAAGRGDGTFRTPTYQYTLLAPGDPLTPYDLAAADFNSDGVLELLIGARSKGIYPATPSCTTQLDLYSVSPMVSIAQQATLHAHLSGFGPDTPMPHGTITLRDGATVVQSLPVDPDGKVTFSLSGLTLGAHLLTAEFSGNIAVTAATSVVVTQKVTTATTKTTLTLPDFPAIYGQPYPIRIKVEGWFADEVVTVELDGVRSRHYTSTPFAPPLEPGRHTISAFYRGDTFRPPSDPLPVTFDVAKATPAMSKAGPLAVRTGTAHSFTFQVSGPGARGPAGSVQLTEGTTLLGSGELVNGSTTIAFTLTRGAHDVRAIYSGDARYAGVAQSFTLEVLPNQPFAIEARGLTTGVHIAYVLPPDVNLKSLQLYRRPASGRLWQLVPGWNPATGMDSNLRTRGLVFEYLLHASLHNGTHISTLPDSALLFHDDPLPDGAVVKRVHFTELRSAVNLLRAQAGLAPFEFDGGYTKSSPASHLSGLRTALTQARQTLGMSVPAFMGGELVQAAQIQELRELAR